MFKRLLILGWIVLFGWVLSVGIFPKLLGWLPRPGVVGAFVVLFIMISFVYGIVLLFRAGMKNSKSNLR